MIHKALRPCRRESQDKILLAEKNLNVAILTFFKLIELILKYGQSLSHSIVLLHGMQKFAEKLNKFKTRRIADHYSVTEEIRVAFNSEIKKVIIWRLKFQ